jgi:hypothetical protein
MRLISIPSFLPFSAASRIVSNAFALATLLNFASAEIASEMM